MTVRGAAPGDLVITDTEVLMNRLALALSLLAACASEPSDTPSDAVEVGADTTETASADPNAALFDRAVVRRLDIRIAAEDYATMQADLTEMLGEPGTGGGGGGIGGGPPAGGPPGGGEPPAGGGGGGGGGGGAVSLLPRDPVSVPASLTWEGIALDDVGVRYKGNSSIVSLWSQGNRKLPFRIDTDAFVEDGSAQDGQELKDWEELTFAPNFSDASQIREAFVSTVLEARGVPVAPWAFVRVWVDVGEGPEYWGLYTMVGDPSDNEALEGMFDSHDGNLYKPDGAGADWTAFDPEGFVKKNHEDEADWSDVQAAIAALHASTDDDEAWRAGLEATFDVDGFLNWLAINTVVVNWDVYGALAHNYYLYGDPAIDGRLRWIPWDHNLAMMEGRMGSDTSDLLHTDVGEQWPLIRFLMDDPVWRDQYLDQVAAVIDGPLAADAVTDTLTELHERVAPWVIGDHGEVAGSTTVTSEAEFTGSVSALSSFLDARRELAVETLEGR